MLCDSISIHAPWNPEDITDDLTLQNVENAARDECGSLSLDNSPFTYSIIDEMIPPMNPLLLHHNCSHHSHHSH